MKKQLIIDVEINGKEIETSVYEPESGDVAVLNEVNFNCNNTNSDFYRDLINEISSWISLWADEAED